MSNPILHPRGPTTMEDGKARNGCGGGKDVEHLENFLKTLAE